MGKNFHYSALVLVIFLSSCKNAIQTPTSPPVEPFAAPGATVTATSTIPPTLTPALIPTTTQTNIPTPTKQPVIEPTFTPFLIESTPLNSDIPVIPNAQNVSNADWVVEIFGKRGNTISYQVDASLEEIKSFYLDQLQKEGWTWVYTDSGESLITTSPGPALFMEFRKDNTRLGVGAIGFGFFGEGAPVFAGTGYSGATLVLYYIAGIAGGFDLSGAREEDMKQDAMVFTSEYLEFKHPSNWHPNENLMQIIPAGKDIIFISDAGSCKVTQQPCFVNFTDLLGSQFDIPISIRLHPELFDLTLEQADTIRWEELNNMIPNQKYDFPENLMKPGSLESIEVRAIVLGDGTPALQRIYRWEGEGTEGAAIPGHFISTYTLYKSSGLLIEFHTDFTSEEWQKEKSTIDHMISGMVTVP